MTIESICSGCGKRLAVSEEHAGRQARCPVCQQIYTVPLPDYPAPLPQSTAQQPDYTAQTDWQAPNAAIGSSAAAQQSAVGQPDMFWMQASDGSEYGPVDRANLDRWFQEGRVGPGYRIRRGEHGAWNPADMFRPGMSLGTSAGGSTGGSASPYYPGSTTYPGSATASVYAYPKSDQSILILVMAIGGFILCPIFSLVAWIMGGSALRSIQAGEMDPRNKGLVQAGYYLGIINCVLTMLSIGVIIVLFALAAVSQ